MAFLFHREPQQPAPQLTGVDPIAAMPGGQVLVRGRELGPQEGHLPQASIGEVSTPVLLARPGQLVLQVPEGSISGDVVVQRHGSASNPLPLRIAVPMAENLHPVANPAVDSTGNVYATLSGARGQSVPVSIFQITRDFQLRPFVRNIMNASGLAFDAAGYLYTSSRAEGTVYRISPAGAVSVYAEGLGIATGLAFDLEGNLFVGDRSGTIFRVAANREIFVHATLEPSMAAYHLAFDAQGVLYVSGPTTSSNQAIHTIDRDGNVSVFYRGLGRAQGMAFDVAGNLYIAASLHGQRGVVRITPQREASLAVAGADLVGLAFVEDGCAVLATREALYHLDLGVDGQPLPGTRTA
ncbi:MAG: gluconolaconase [Acidobacteriota bacterium]|nr:gluconolaconase [Acidobacteriota bacterium]